MTTLLITGANGFVGSHVLEAAMQTPDLKVIAACRDRKKLIPSFQGEVREGDLRDPAYMESVLEGVDVVCHTAAWTSAWSHKENTRELYYEPSVRFIDKVIEKGVSRFLYISTTSAASPDRSNDPMSRGICRSLWPHLCSVVGIEDYMRDHADQGTTMVNLRVGIFAGQRYGVGILPLLCPRLKTHLVPWVAGGKTSLPMIDGRDVGQAFVLAATAPGLSGYEGFNIVGPEVPTTRQVIEFLHDEFGYPKPHFGVPFPIAYAFARLMELIDPIVPWEPLVTRSIVHLLEEVNANNERAEQKLGFKPKIHWKDAVRTQMAEMKVRQVKPMRMAKPIN